MLSTADSAAEMSTESIRTDSYYNETTTTSEGRNPVTAGSLLPFQIPVVVIALLGITANGFVLGSFWFYGRSKLTTAMWYIANQTTLARLQSPFP